MDLRRTGAKSSVVAGSVWETRMRSDEIKGGFKVFNGEDDSNGEENSDKGLSLKKGQTFGKRKTWKSESFDGFEKNPIQISKGKAEEQCKKSPIRVAKGRSSSMENCKDLSLSVDGGIKKIPPVQVKKGVRDLSKSVDGIARTPIQSKKLRSEVQVRKVKSDTVKVSSAQSGDGNGNKVLVLDNEKIEVNVKDSNEKDGSLPEENCREFGVCQEMVISSNGNMAKSSPEISVEDDIDDDDDDDEFYEDEEEEMEIGDEKKSFDIKEINVPEVEKPNKDANEVTNMKEDKPSKVANEVMKISQSHNKAAPFSSTVNKQPPPVVKCATPVYTTSAKTTKPTPSSDDYHYQSFPQTQNKLQSLVDLVMWRDVSKSALIFGVGTFITISSSYTQDLNISFITVISYVGLVYLAAIFFYRSIICRGIVDIDESSCVVGEEEAIWVLKLVLPYLNEFLLKLRALFSGDPSTTMKLAVLLFVLARCGSSITIWKMAKLGFFGVFIVPKVCSSYSHQITAYGKFWIRRFRDAWESCTHKKAVAVAIFTLVWNLSSIVARIWAAFMLFVAFRYYQHKIVTGEWNEAETGLSNSEESRQGPAGRRRQHGVGSSKIVVPNKLKKGS
ncbi:reticulon 21 [Hibiscus trionum]|uniref:Reticulon-like protein n=1 Tax=Hibiscus trionum TaxID=183268 RepID=A0A9W7J6T9_HIBTR|nr:reticulon 21 [Hibiscus trionum]